MQDFVFLPLSTPFITESESSRIKLGESSLDPPPRTSSPSPLFQVTNPNIPSSSFTPTTPPISFNRSAIAAARAKRASHPYLASRDSSGQRQRRHYSNPTNEISNEMSAPNYESWSSSTQKNSHDYISNLPRDPRKSSDNNSQQSYYLPQNSSGASSVRRQGNRSDMRSPSSASNSSSLTGAMGDTAISSSTASQPRVGWESDTALGGAFLPVGLPMQPNLISSYASPTSPVPSNTPGPFVSYPHYNQAAYASPSGSVGFATSSYSSSSTFNYPAASRSLPSTTTHSPSSLSGSPLLNPARDGRNSMRRDSLEEENKHLRERVSQLETQNEQFHRHIRQLQMAVEGYGVNPSGLPMPQPLPSSPAFQESWSERTEARNKTFCSLNRAGNALCSWHDSRRERRAHPARGAPPGTLNCGCTYEEALFEDSLTRHNVGSYSPGDKVRMDPALRNPLLQLLKRRYGYMDGDFERDPVTGQWIDAEGPAVWREIADSPNPKKKAEEKRAQWEQSLQPAMRSSHT